MKEYTSENIRNVVLLGQSGSGKSELLESMLYNFKLTDRFGKAVDGTSTIDADTEEVKRGMTVYSHVVPIEYHDTKINFIDTPGYMDFAGETAAAMAVADSAVIVVSAKDGVQPGTMKAYRAALAKKLPVIFFVTRVDEEHADFVKVVDEIKARCKATVFTVTHMENGVPKGTVDSISQKAIVLGEEVEIPEEWMGNVEQDHMDLCEAIAMLPGFDDLAEKFLMEEPFTEEEMKTGLCEGLKTSAIKPILTGSATKFVGIRSLLKTIISYTPAYIEKGDVTDANGKKIITTADGAFSAFVWKTVTDNFAQASYIKVMSGVLTPDVAMFNTNKEENEKVSSMVVIRGNKQEKVTRLEAGDIGAILKLATTSTNETLATKANPIQYSQIEFPKGMLGKAVWAKSKNDEDKLSEGLKRICGEDKSLKVVNNEETRERVLYGIGDQHIDVVVNKLKSRFKVEVELTQPTVQYRETIRGRAEVQGKHKKQSGGAGQYGDVWIRFETNPEQDDMVFAEEVVGGAVSKNFFPAVESGLREAMNKGVLAGFKVVQVKATLYDGSMHPVDSKEVAFKAAARLAYKKGMPMAKPCLLEPIVRAEVQIPTDYVGTIYGDFSKRRGMIMENNAIDDETTEIIAEVPQAEMMNYATELRSMTQGTGSFTQEFIRYEKAPKEVEDKVVAEAKSRMEEDDED